MKTQTQDILKIGLATIALWAAVGCSPQAQVERGLASVNDSSSIVNGEIVVDQDVISKSTVAIYLKYPDSNRVQNFCTGTIINDDTIVTAAHCMADVAQMFDLTVDQLLPRLRIGLGLGLVKSFDDKRATWLELRAATVHPDYRIESDALENAEKGIAFHDIAIIRLAQKVPAPYKAAKMMASPERLVAGLKLTLAGYGVTRGAPFATPSNELRKTEVVVAKPALNPTQFQYDVIDGHSACSGDSGGPAYLVENGQLTLVGVTSWGDNSCVKQGVYTSIPAMHAWIQQTIL